MVSIRELLRASAALDQRIAEEQAISNSSVPDVQKTESLEPKKPKKPKAEAGKEAE